MADSPGLDIPRGTVTFLFTDVVDSTGLFERYTDAIVHRALDLHVQVMRREIRACGGHFFKTVGDSVCAAFHDASSGVTCAVQGQRALATADWRSLCDGFETIGVRMALHRGVVRERDGDYFGLEVNRAARLVSVSHGGQVLLSGDVRDDLAGFLPPDATLHDWGEHQLRGLNSTARIYQLLAPGTAEELKPPDTVHGVVPGRRIIVSDDSDGSEPGSGASSEQSVDELIAAVRDAATADHHVACLTIDEAVRIASHRPSTIEEQRLGRIADWCQPRYRIGEHFVNLSLLVDQGEHVAGERWQPGEHVFTDLRTVLEEVPDPALVLLGSPGSGKSTLLRRLELDVNIAALRGATDVVTCFASLNHYRPGRAGDPPPDPLEWLTEIWRSRYPDLPGLGSLLQDRRVLLLLDGLNEMPHAGDAQYRELVQAWKRFLCDVVGERSGNRAVIACRSLEYSAPLSSFAMRVPQVLLEPLGDEQVREFLDIHCPAWSREVWTKLHESPQLDMVRVPYFLKLLVSQVVADGRIPEGPVALISSFVREAMRREIERDNRTFEPGELVTCRDTSRILQWQRSDRMVDLPDQGCLVPTLSALAYAMQHSDVAGDASEVRIDHEAACELIGDRDGDAVLRAAEMLGIIVEDVTHDDVLFCHQLMQEFFAGRRLARSPEPDLVSREWRAARVEPHLRDVVASLNPADPLPSLPATRWDETMVMAGALTEDPDAFVLDLADENLAVAARCAANPETRVRDVTSNMLRVRLVHRARDAEADLRSRITAAHELGVLGDPRFERLSGENGEYLSAPMIDIPGGQYVIGAEESGSACSPEHHVRLAPFQIGQFPVTNAEWALFVAAGGYDGEIWWDTPDAAAWRSGIGTAEASRMRDRDWRTRLTKVPRFLHEQFERGHVPQRVYEAWCERLAMSETAFEIQLETLYPGGRLTAPEYWMRRDFNSPAQPVVGISWYEARAYCSWLSSQAGLRFRLPTEVEWEAAARGTGGRRYAYGRSFDPRRCNTVETHVRRTTPIGVFPGGDTPASVTDMTGNVNTWTDSLHGTDVFQAEFGYPYDPTDGREDPLAAKHIYRSLRGGSWAEGKDRATAFHRLGDLPGVRGNNAGMRLACDARRPVL
jgi:formylglycine-generating enzyme required for sulfatase activity/class 3 adenylate cyclase